MPPLKHSDHKKFVETEGWAEMKAISGGHRDHFRCQLTLATGDILYARVSHGTGQLDSADVVKAVFRDQLQVTEKDFYACVRDRVLPPRPQPELPAPQGETIDATLMRNLVRKVGLTADELSKFTQAEAVRKWQEYLTADGT